MNFEHAEHDRQIANLIRFGTIEAVNHEAKLIRVRSGDAVTGWLPWPAEVGSPRQSRMDGLSPASFVCTRDSFSRISKGSTVSPFRDEVE
uniref:Type VI secretion system, phage-baseplate injector n=1 Tax=Candidatus Kentrum sp. FM TaxID=2126340 RepID=A0A450SLQ6_9GAMM|nr:MAG: Type VI secretion system, phage-baseplate injector [Candidatus Kentron sp. FM]VFJ54586.1 MAG: Type VI secretion system, phage-baseplate injector [Candidatus Kentron sp. FM]VFK10369.1 MAG: Type VI secretion system, phage-baseplate injector [Candidatus Kentron sp. FM]